MGGEAGTITVLIVDPDSEFRRIVKRELDRGLIQQVIKLPIWNRGRIRVVAEVEDGEEAVRLASVLKPDVILMDISMPRLDGLEATRRIKAERPDAKVVIVTVHNEKMYRRAATECGADGYVVKRALLSGLFAAILDHAQRA